MGISQKETCNLRVLEDGWFGLSVIDDRGVTMHNEQIDDVREKWRRCTVRDKSMVINDFLCECGEDATWEDWLNFLHTQHQLKGFEWILSVE